MLMMMTNDDARDVTQTEKKPLQPHLKMFHEIHGHETMIRLQLQLMMKLYSASLQDGGVVVAEMKGDDDGVDDGFLHHLHLIARTILTAIISVQRHVRDYVHELENNPYSKILRDGDGGDDDDFQLPVLLQLKLLDEAMQVQAIESDGPLERKKKKKHDVDSGSADVMKKKKKKTIVRHHEHNDDDVFYLMLLLRYLAFIFKILLPLGRHRKKIVQEIQKMAAQTFFLKRKNLNNNYKTKNRTRKMSF